jgi:hypothetical protein
MLLNVHVRRKILRKGLDKICRLTGHGELRRMISVLPAKAVVCAVFYLPFEREP